MKITGISAQVKNNNRVNISVDGSYRFSLDIFQLGHIGIRVGNEYTEDELSVLETESQYGKLYAQTLEYSLMRPHSIKEVRDYLWRKTRDTKYKTRTGVIKEREGVDQVIADRVLERLIEKKYVNDETFARFWVENRNQIKGTSIRKLTNELRLKGVAQVYINSALSEVERSDESELIKVILKKRSRYDDQQKFIQYLARQGFSYESIKTALQADNEERS